MMSVEQLRQRLSEVLQEFEQHLIKLENGEMTTCTSGVDDTAVTAAWVRERITMLREAQQLLDMEHATIDQKH